MGCTRKSGVKNDYKVICTSNGNGLDLPSTEMRKAATESGLGGWRHMKRSILDILNLRCQMCIWTGSSNLEVLACR